MTDKRTFTWTDTETCPTCGSTDATKNSHGFNGYTEAVHNGKTQRAAKDGVTCGVCGCTWHQIHALRTDGYMVKEIVVEGDLYAD